MNTQIRFAKWVRQVRPIDTLERLQCGMQQYDASVHMPPGGAVLRGEQSGHVMHSYRQQLLSPSFVEATRELGEDTELTPDQRCCIDHTLRQIDRMERIDTRLLSDLERAQARALAGWKEGMRQGSFKAYAPALQQMIDCKRREARALDIGATPYDALMDEHEPRSNSEAMIALFASVTARLRPVIDSVRERKIDKRMLEIRCDNDRFIAFCRSVIAHMGFDFRYGTLDFSDHPFTFSFGPRDVRITTWRDNGFCSTLASSVHEAYHGMYEQQLPWQWRGTGRAHAGSMGMHESQSLLGEAFEFRRLEFWEWVLPRLQREFVQLRHLTPTEIFRAVNAIEPSLIRTEADPITYIFHILVRLICERQMINGDLNAVDLPERFDSLMETHLGVRPPNPMLGCMRDVHHAYGAFGYFSCYGLGLIRGAQLNETLAGKLHGHGLAHSVKRERYGFVKGWLGENIHRYGMLHTPKQLMISATGDETSGDALVRHAKQIRKLVYR